MKQENTSVRNMARNAGVPLWKIAAALNVSEPTIYRWLRFPLSEEKINQITNAINHLSEEAKASG